MRPSFISNDFPLVARSFLLLFCLLLNMDTAGADPRNDLNQVRRHLHTLQQEYRQTQLRHASAHAALTAANKAIAASVLRLTTLQAQQTGVQSSLTHLQQQGAALEIQMASMRSALGQDLRYAYQHPGSDPLKLILSSDDPNQTARDLRYLAILAARRQARIQGLTSHQEQLTALQQQAAARSAQLAGIASELRTQQALLVKQRQERQDLLAHLDRKIAAQKSEITSLKRDEARLSRLMEKLAREAAAREAALRRQEQARRRAQARHEQGTPPTRVRGTVAGAALPSGVPFASLRGRLAWPVTGELMNHFGAPRQGGALTWKGIFIRTPTGTAVRSVASGRVVFADRMRGFGDLIIINHGGGYMSLYSNNENLYKQVGDAVAAGDVIARTGDADGRSGEYFELRYQGRAINPEQWIR